MTPWLYMGTLGLTWLQRVSFLLWLIQQNALSFKACYITADCCLIHSPYTEDTVLTLLVTALTHFHCNPCFPNQKRGSIHVHDSFVAGIGRQPFAKSRLSLTSAVSVEVCRADGEPHCTLTSQDRARRRSRCMPPSIIAMGITTALSVKQTLTSHLKPVHLETQTIKHCSGNYRCSEPGSASILR